MLIAQHPGLFTVTMLAALSWLALYAIGRYRYRRTPHLPWYLWVGEFGMALVAAMGLAQLALYACP